MSMPGFAAEASLYAGSSYLREAVEPAEAGQVVPAIPPCHACDDILDKCATGLLSGAICHYCATGFCDLQEWRRPRHPFPPSEPWNVPF